MGKARIFVIAALCVGFLLSFSIFYKVRFTEAAVVTLFGKATEDDVRRDPGLGIKWPYPIQSVTKYDTRTRILPVRLEQLNTLDNRQIIVEVYCTWRVDDPLKFFQRFSNAGERPEDHYRAAEEALRTNLRSVTALVSGFKMGQLFASGSESGLMALEGQMLTAFSGGADRAGFSLADYGIKAVDVGVTRVLMPEETTKAVIERMKAGRDRIALETQSQGDSQARSIRTTAETDASRITAFASRLAQDIRTRGDLEAAPFLAKMNQNAELAVFLDNIEFIRNMEGKSTTLVLSGSMPGMGLIRPNALDGLKAGAIPPFETPKSWITGLIDSGVQPAAAANAEPSAPGANQ